MRLKLFHVKFIAAVKKCFLQSQGGWKWIMQYIVKSLDTIFEKSIFTILSVKG